MKILHIVTTLSPRYGGPSKVCREMCRMLAERGEDVTIYTTDRDYPKGRLNVPTNKPITENGYTVWYFPVQFASYMFSLDMWKALQRNAEAFDVFHIHGLYRFPQTIAAYYARKNGIPYIIRTHGSLDPFLFNRPKNRYVKRLYEYLLEMRNLNKASIIHYTTEEEMLLTQPLDIDAQGIVIPNGIILDEYENLPPSGKFRESYNIGDQKIILFLGRINFKKGLDILIQAFSQVCLDRDDVLLVIAGPDNEGYKKQVESWISREKIESKTIFTGMLHGADKLAAFRDADLFALSSYTENFGMTVVEAMACETPVVISDKVNIWREVQGAAAGLVTPCDTTQFANALSELLNNDDRRHQLGKNGKVFVTNYYNWNTIVFDLIELYKDLVTKNSVTLYGN